MLWRCLGKSRPLLYKVGVESLLPFWSDPDDGKSGLDLTTLEINGMLGIKLFSWMSLDYHLKVVREPLLLDGLQVQNNLLLNFSYALLDQSLPRSLTVSAHPAPSKLPIKSLISLLHPALSPGHDPHC